MRQNTIMRRLINLLQPNRDERAWSAVPWLWRGMVVGLILLCVGLAQVRPTPQALATELPAAPSLAASRIMTLGEHALGAKLLLLWLQAFDNQPGVSISFRRLDYARVQQWLDVSMHLDAQSQLALLMASRLYAEVAEPVRQRQMLEYVAQRFMQDPNRRWPWVAHAVYVARHNLHDLPLASRYASLLAQHATGAQVPGWARQMDVLLQADMNDTQTAAVLLGALLDSGTVKDPAEFKFLQSRLTELQNAAAQPKK